MPCGTAARTRTLAATVLGSSLAFIDGSVVNVALPAIQRDLGAGAAGTQWVMNAYLVVLGALVLIGGASADRFGRRRVFVAGVTVFTAASILCGLAAGTGTLVATRALQGAGAALLVPASLALLGATFPAGERARAIGAWAGYGALAMAVGPLLGAWQALRVAFVRLDRMIDHAAADDPICRLLMTAPGVGPVVALAFRTGVDDVHRFAKSRLVGVHFGLTPRKYASGRIDRDGHITKCGDAMVRAYLFEAAHSILARLRKPCALRGWALELAQRTSSKHAKVALARRLAAILHRMWLTGEPFRWPPATMA